MSTRANRSRSTKTCRDTGRLGLPNARHNLLRPASLDGPWTPLATVMADGTGYGTFVYTNAPLGRAYCQTVSR
jgi:hypothetical protein